MTEQEKRENVIKGLECCAAYEYKCNDCPYQDDGGAEDDCYSDELYADALALLKAQEPRVMTYDELNRLHTDDVIWLEDIDKAEVIPAIVCGAPDYSSILDAVELCAYYRDKYIIAITKDYLERWRCWTSRPTDEQREATPWN